MHDSLKFPGCYGLKTYDLTAKAESYIILGLLQPRPFAKPNPDGALLVFLLSSGWSLDVVTSFYKRLNTCAVEILGLKTHVHACGFAPTIWFAISLGLLCLGGTSMVYRPCVGWIYEIALSVCLVQLWATFVFTRSRFRPFTNTSFTVRCSTRTHFFDIFRVNVRPKNYVMLLSRSPMSSSNVVAPSLSWSSSVWPVILVPPWC
jgi:hypothetical protein